MGHYQTWVKLERRFPRQGLADLPRIDGSLLRKAILLSKNNKSCAGDMVLAGRSCAGSPGISFRRKNPEC
jgi:hypothetical protein